MSEAVKNIIDNILDNNYVEAENDIHGILNSKIFDAFEEIQTSMGSEYAAAEVAEDVDDTDEDEDWDDDDEDEDWHDDDEYEDDA